MNCKELMTFLSTVPEDAQVVFEIVENGVEPDTSYSVDQVVFQNGFFVLRSQD